VLVLREQVDARALLGQLREAGVLLTLAGGSALRFSPPLVIERTDLDEGLAIVDRELARL
jgi:4-aminobutyrate aminotransferase-like enzyme